MTATNQQGLVAKQGLIPQELTDIEQLAALCNEHDGIELKLNYDTLRKRPADSTNDFLYYEKGQLVGFFPLFVFNSREAEVSGMVHPEYRRKGIFSLLLEAGLAELKKRNIPNTIFIVHTNSTSGKSFAESQGASYSFSEYKMYLAEANLQPKKHANLHLERATEAYSEFLAHCTAIAFNMPKQDVNWMKFTDEGRRYYVIKLDEEPVGTIATRVEPDESFIYGFAMMPEHQGKGYGRQILSEIVQGLVAEGQTKIELEVAANNPSALGLYQSCGFKVDCGYDYYTRPTEG